MMYNDICMHLYPRRRQRRKAGSVTCFRIHVCSTHWGTLSSDWPAGIWRGQAICIHKALLSVEIVYVTGARCAGPALVPRGFTSQRYP